MNCPRTGCKNEAVVDKVLGVLPCLQCQKADSLPINRANPEFVSLSKSDRIQHQRDYGAKDLLQPFEGNKPNPEFARAYPKLVKNYYTKEELKRL